MSKGKSEESAGAICGAIEKRMQRMAVRETENTFRVRIKPPEDFQQDSFRIIDIDKAKGVKAVIGRLRGETTTTTQAFIFPKDNFTKDEASEWVKNHSERRFILTEIFLADEFRSDTDFEILTTAKQTDLRYGDFQYKKEELEQMAENFNSDVVGTEIAVDLNHDENGIALAWIVPSSMRVDKSSKLENEYSLYAKLHRFTPKGEEMLKTGALRYFSVELQFKLKKFVGGVKKVFQNVIRGLALTNRPVIKEMSPTFSEIISSKFYNQFTMEKLTELFNSLKAKDSLTKEEFKKFQDEADKAVKAEEATAEKTAGMEAELEPKVEKTNEEKEAEEKAKKEAEEAEEKAKEMTDKILADKKGTYSKADVEEIVKMVLKEPLKQINQVMTDVRAGRITEQVDKLVLSENKQVGFKADSKKKVVEFVKKLTDELAKEYFALHGDIITSVDLSEIGHSEEVISTPTETHKELKEKAEKVAKTDNINYSQAVKKVLSEDKALAKRIEELETKSV